MRWIRYVVPSRMLRRFRALLSNVGTWLADAVCPERDRVASAPRELRGLLAQKGQVRLLAHTCCKEHTRQDGERQPSPATHEIAATLRSRRHDKLGSRTI